MLFEIRTRSNNTASSTIVALTGAPSKIEGARFINRWVRNRIATSGKGATLSGIRPLSTSGKPAVRLAFDAAGDVVVTSDRPFTKDEQVEEERRIDARRVLVGSQSALAEIALASQQRRLSDEELDTVVEILETLREQTHAAPKAVAELIDCCTMLLGE